MNTLLLFSLTAPLTLAGEDSGAYEHPFETDAHREPGLTTGGSALIRGATVHSAVDPARVADVLVRDGRIAAIGQGLDLPEGVVVLAAALHANGDHARAAASTRSCSAQH